MKHLEYIEDGDRYYLILKNPTQEEKEKFINIAKQMFDVSVEPEILDEMKDINEIPDKVVVEKKNEDKKVQNANMQTNANVQTKPQTQEKPQPQKATEQQTKPQQKPKKLTVYEVNDFKNTYILLRTNQLSEKEQQAFKKNSYIFFNKNYFTNETFEKQKELVESLYDTMWNNNKKFSELTEKEIKDHYYAIKNYIVKWK